MTVHSGRVLTSLAVALVLLTLAPFAAVLEVHHVLAAADHDGHQHSDFDLCQWVQHHTGSSIVTGMPAIGSLVTIAVHDAGDPGLSISISFVPVGPSRGPPLS